MKNGLYHTILISFRSDTPDQIKDEIYNRYQTLDKECGGEKAGILFWSVQKNLDQRKNVHLVELAIFKDQESLNLFKNHPKHEELVRTLLIDNCDWQVGDFFLNN